MRLRTTDIRQSPVGALWHLLPDRHRAGTSIFDFESAGSVYTKFQCGSHFFMDADYGRISTVTAQAGSSRRRISPWLDAMTFWMRPRFRSSTLV